MRPCPNPITAVREKKVATCLMSAVHAWRGRRHGVGKWARGGARHRALKQECMLVRHPNR